MSEAEQVQQRFVWAHAILTEAGFMEWGQSDAHGLSRYYIPNGSELEDESIVRVRVSDHYAHPTRYGEAGDVAVDFQVDVSAASREEIEKATRQAIRERAAYLRTDEYREVCAQRNRLLFG
jgi:hypothetical protein